MAPGPGFLSFLVRSDRGDGRRPQRTYMNRVTRLFFEELGKGFQSRLVTPLGTLCTMWVGWSMIRSYVEPTRELTALRIPGSRVPLNDDHNAFWGLRRSVPVGSLPQTMGDSVETELQRPALLASETSERDPGTEWVVLESSEFDPNTKTDVYFRSVHSLRTSGSAPAPSPTESAKDEGPQAGDEYVARKAEATGEYAAGEKQFIREGHIHGMTKCKAISAQNNCIPMPGHLADELSRKFMVSLGPLHILRDMKRLVFKWRFTTVAEAHVDVLVCGIKSGDLPRWLSAAFPSFHVDVVEADGTLVRLCRRYLGLRDHKSLRAIVADPVDYLRKVSGGEVDKKYDLIVLDCVDGENRLSTVFGRLEFINNVRRSLTNAGMVAINVPNKDPRFVYNMVQNWRMGFHGKTALLVHCESSCNTIVLLFQDNADRGKSNLGTVASVEEFADLLRLQVAEHGNNRIAFDLTKEVSRANFKVLAPGKEYQVDDYLPEWQRRRRQRDAAAGATRDNAAGSQQGGRGIRGWLGLA